MIVDAHAHIVDHDWLSPRCWSLIADSYGSNAAVAPLSRGTRADIRERLCDPDGSRLLEAMDRAQIDVSIVLPLDWGIVLGEPAVSIEEQHERIAGICRGSKGRIVAFAGIDPRRPDAVEIVRSCLRDYGMRGIKLYPSAGFDLYDEAYHPLFEAAMEYRVPVVLHTGFSFGPFQSRFCEPSLLDFLCGRYPDLTFVAAHLGAGQLQLLSWLGYARPNLRADCSLMQIRARQRYHDFANDLRLACDLFGSARVMFGTDWPFSRNVMESDAYVKAFRKLTAADSTTARFAHYEVAQMLGAGAATMLSLPEGRTE